MTMEQKDINNTINYYNKEKRNQDKKRRYINDKKSNRNKSH